ncbi:MAG: hypothetical protein Q8N76_03890 [Candidatus Omnitrophota bacterium]|nr:hypothetical protein [Candidatus Omnitrophota bacterium]
MMRKTWFLSLVAAIILSLGVFTFNLFGKDNSSGSNDGVQQLSEKIDKVLRNQENIITKLADIRQELDVIRVRASRR